MYTIIYFYRSILNREDEKEHPRLYDNLDEYRATFSLGERLIQLPLDMFPMAPKGQFFDIAFNCLAYPEASEDLQEPEENKSKGFLSFLGI